MWRPVTDNRAGPGPAVGAPRGDGMRRALQAGRWHHLLPRSHPSRIVLGRVFGPAQLMTADAWLVLGTLCEGARLVANAQDFDLALGRASEEIDALLESRAARRRRGVIALDGLEPGGGPS